VHTTLVVEYTNKGGVVVAGQRLYNDSMFMRVLLLKTPTRVVVVVAGQGLYNDSLFKRVLLVITPTRG
jgi:hypothetical protein